MKKHLVLFTLVLVMCILPMFAEVFNEAQAHFINGVKQLNSRVGIYAPEDFNMAPPLYAYMVLYSSSSVSELLVESWDVDNEVWVTQMTISFSYGDEGITQMVWTMIYDMQQMITTYDATYSAGKISEILQSTEVVAREPIMKENYVWSGDDLVSWSTYMYNITGSNWLDYMQGTITYTNGNPTDFNLQEWDDPNWDDKTHCTATYDANGHQLVHIEEDIPNVEFERTTMNWNGDEIADRLEEIGTDGTNWSNDENTIFSWADGHMTLNEFFQWDGSTWVNEGLDTFTYNGTTLTQVLHQQWVDDLRGWVDHTRYTYTGGNSVNPQEVPPVAFKLANYPNPFNPETTISFNLTQAGDVKLEVFVIKGRKVTTLVNTTLGVGSHTANWNGLDADGNGVASGVYFYKMQTAMGTATGKMLLMKQPQ